MTERPILFSAPMVRAILADRKSQTRRVVKWPRSLVPLIPCWARAEVDRGFGDGQYLHVPANHPDDPEGELTTWETVQRVRCTYADTPGDRLWVKETWQDNRTRCWAETIETPTSSSPAPDVLYRADGITLGGIRWRSPRYMPRWASRLTLEVTDVRAERVQEITPEAAWAEGCRAYGPHGEPDDPREDFRALWDSINAKRGYGWAKNPWVWTVAFQVAGRC